MVEVFQKTSLKHKFQRNSAVTSYESEMQMLRGRGQQVGEETKEDLITENVAEYQKSPQIVEKVRTREISSNQSVRIALNRRWLCSRFWVMLSIALSRHWS